MGTFVKALMILFPVLFFALGVLWVFGPREEVVIDFRFEQSLPWDLDSYLTNAEQDIPALRESAQRRIVWHNGIGGATPISVLYVHGFSATAQEIRPVPDLVAQALEANLHYMRFTGHGRDGASLAQATAYEWSQDLAEAIAISNRLGQSTVVIATSTGGTIAALAALEPNVMENVAGIIFVSPNFDLPWPALPVLTGAFARQYLPVLLGDEIGPEGVSADFEKHWTARYPPAALLPMAATVKHLQKQNFRAAQVPALFLYAEKDRVVSAQATKVMAQIWGGPSTLIALELTEQDDPNHHVIAGDILSPNMTQKAASTMVGWVKSVTP